jgi:hypothetical protein
MREGISNMKNLRIGILLLDKLCCKRNPKNKLGNFSQYFIISKNVEVTPYSLFMVDLALRSYQNNTCILM